MATTFIIDIYGKKDMFDYIVINTGDINIVDFNMAEEKRRHLMELGYSQTMDYFNETLPAKKQMLLGMYSKLYDKLTKILKYLKKLNINKAKCLTTELFIDLCEDKDFIETKFYDYILEFKDIFFKNIQYPALFGKTSLNKADIIISYLTNIIDSMNDKIKEIKEFLEP